MKNELPDEIYLFNDYWRLAENNAWISSCNDPYTENTKYVRADLAESRGWRTIESAPRNNHAKIAEPILGYAEGRGIRQMYWEPVSQDWNFYGGFHYMKPTHWCPLPTPPSERKNHEYR